MLTIPPPKYRKNRKGAKQQAAVQAPALVLVEADYDDGNELLVLEFDRAIDLTGFDGSLININDAVYNNQFYLGNGGAEQLSATRVQLTLNAVTAATGEGVTLSAAAGNGIISSDDGGAWPGVTGLELPFP